MWGGSVGKQRPCAGSCLCRGCRRGDVTVEVFSTALPWDAAVTVSGDIGLVLWASSACDQGFAGMLFFSPDRRFPDLVTARGVEYPARVDGKTPVPCNDASQNLLASK